jgi:hypothetical protein
LLPLGFCLRSGVAAFAILGPVEREPVSHKPVSDIRPTDGADRHRALVSVAIYLDAFDEATTIVVVQCIRCFLPATVLVAASVVAKLIGFRRIDSEYANAGAVNFDGVAVDNGYLTDQFVSECSAANGKQNGADKSSHFRPSTSRQKRAPIRLHGRINLAIEVTAPSKEKTQGGISEIYAVLRHSFTLKQLG